MLSTLERTLILRSVSIFSDIDDDQLAALAPLVREVEVTAGECVIEEGTIGTTLFVIVSGRVRVHVGERLITEQGDRAVFGELSALDAEPRSASVTALEDTLLFALEQDALYDLMSEHVALTRGIIHILCQRLRSMVNR